jgi:hypothetical protein
VAAQQGLGKDQLKLQNDVTAMAAKQLQVLYLDAYRVFRQHSKFWDLLILMV